VRHMRGEWEIWPLVRVVRRMDGPSERLVSESYGGFRKILFCERTRSGIGTLNQLCRRKEPTK
jgi:hypothetical protein